MCVCDNGWILILRAAEVTNWLYVCYFVFSEMGNMLCTLVFHIPVDNMFDLPVRHAYKIRHL